MNNNPLPHDDAADEISHGDRVVELSPIQNFLGKFKLQTVLIFSLVFVVVLAIATTGILTHLNSQYAMNDLALQVENQVSDRIILHLDMYLEIPHHINQLCLDSIMLGEVSVHDNTALERHFQELLYHYSMAEAICYGAEADGNYVIVSRVGAPGIANGSDLFLGYSRKETNFTFEEYRISRDGTVLEKTISLPDYDPRIRPWYQSAVRAGGPAWTPVYQWLEGVVGIDAVLPVYSHEGELIGILDTALTLEGIGEFLRGLEISENGQAFIIDTDGMLVASSEMEDAYIGKNGDLIQISAFESENPVIRSAARYAKEHGHLNGNKTGRVQFSFISDDTGGRQLVQITPYNNPHGLNWLSVVIIPESDFMEGINANTRTTIILILVSIVVTAITCVLLARWVTKPLSVMNESAKRLASGDWSTWKELNRHDELGELSHSFKDMADQLTESFSSLKSSEERYSSLFQLSADAILVFKSFRFVNLNRAGEKMLGITEQEAIGRDIRELFGNVGVAIGEIIEVLLQTQSGGYEDRTITYTVDNNQRFVNIRATRIIENDVVLSLIHIRDITDQRRVIIAQTEREALNEAYNRVSMILQNLPDSTFVVDKNGIIMYWNQAMEELTGYSAKDMIGKGYEVYSKAIVKTERSILINKVLNPDLSVDEFYPLVEHRGESFSTSYWLSLSGEMKYISVIASRLYDLDGSIVGAIESIRDITSHKMAEDALLVANKKLNLLSNITRHDIINKVMVSKGYLSLLKDSSPGPDQKELIDKVMRSLIDIDHFIAFTRTYQELGLKVPVWQDVKAVCNSAIKGVGSDDVLINNKLSDISILADPLMEKVCYNIIENAIRHGENLTQIDITAHETEEGLRISIRDDGIGIPDNQKELVFERGFGRNSGYGLFLVREILSLSGISISENGKYGSGCRFDIDVPRGKFRCMRDN
ncbi:MAG: PAS domain S-box protein [Methanomicrobiales archaeon]|nr:PAS domain S-box protein [Methanomicrobiales archaeon]